VTALLVMALVMALLVMALVMALVFVVADDVEGKSRLHLVFDPKLFDSKSESI